jgi:hypothetical protein
MQGNLLGDEDRFSTEDKELAEEQIVEKQKISDYDIREYPLEILVIKFTEHLEDDRAEIYIPDYQREMVWGLKQKSRFIESLLLNLPIPYLFCADDSDGRTEIIDGSQRIRTIVEYYQDQFELEGLQLLSNLNGFKFSDLPIPRQRRTKKKTIRMIELTSDMDEEARRQMFDRLNTGGTKLTPMEQRIGSKAGKFISFIRDIASNSPLFLQLCPLSEARLKRREEQELILRFFAYFDRYRQFEHRVDLFLDQYLDDMNQTNFDEDAYRSIFLDMLKFVEKHFPIGFRKSQGNSSVPRIRFEAIAVGTALALKENPDLLPSNINAWITSHEFIHLTRSDASNNPGKLANRIHFVRDNLLGRQVNYIGATDVIFDDPRKIDSDQIDFFE